MLSPTLATLRVFLHVTAAAVWVGAQFVLAGMVASVRRDAPQATRAIANGFARIAWPAFFVAFITGIWSLLDIHFGDLSGAAQATLFVKILLAVLSAMFAAVHMIGRTKLALAIGGALGLLCALGALFLGVLLRTAS